MILVVIMVFSPQRRLLWTVSPISYQTMKSACIRNVPQKSAWNRNDGPKTNCCFAADCPFSYQKVEVLNFSCFGPPYYPNILGHTFLTEMTHTIFSLCEVNLQDILMEWSLQHWLNTLFSPILPLSTIFFFVIFLKMGRQNYYSSSPRLSEWSPLLTLWFRSWCWRWSMATRSSSKTSQTATMSSTTGRAGRALATRGIRLDAFSSTLLF